jgi:hypothetical protein
MTDEEVVTYYNDMVDYFGSLPNFEHEPIRFAYYVRLFKYMKERNASIPEDNNDET